MKVAVVSAVRTPIGKARGALAGVDAYKLGAVVIRESLKRAGIAYRDVDEVILGSCFSGDANVARLSLLEAGLPMQIPGQTVDRQCASGLTALHTAAALIGVGQGRVYVAGGTENLSQRPHLLRPSPEAYDRRPPQFHAQRLSPDSIGDPPMGITAENLARHYEITRAEQDTLAMQSQIRAQHAIEAGLFQSQIVSVDVKTSHGEIAFTKDEPPRFDTTSEVLSRLKPAFLPAGTVTAGNSSGINDAASAVVLTSMEYAKEHAIGTLGILTDVVNSGVDPKMMGLGPVPAVRKLLARNGLTLDDIDLIELNEAFASQVLACDRELHLDNDRLNVHGGAIALGHPIGATGAILVTKLLYEMNRRHLRRGIVSMCVGGGQGVAALFERTENLSVGDSVNG